MRKIAIYGGTFNPIHFGHTSLVEGIDITENFDKIIFIPTAMPPHKNISGLISASARIDMLNLALSGKKKYCVSDIEIKRGGKSYTYDTVRELKLLYNDSEIFFICGQDMFFTVEKWYHSAELVKEIKFCVAPRSNNIYENKEILAHLSEIGVEYKIYDTKFLDISSSIIRYNVANNMSINELVDGKVEEYIILNKLYGG